MESPYGGIFMSSVKSNATNRYRLSLLLALTVTVVLLIWAFRGLSIASFWTAIKTVQLPWLGLGLCTFIASYSVRAWRWGTLLSTRQDPGSFRLRQAAVFIGFAGNAVLPASAGEVIRAGLLHRLGHIALGTVIGSIATERLLDATIALILLLLNFPLALHSTHFDRMPLVPIGLVVLLTCGVFLVAANHPEPIARFTGKVGVLLRLRKQQDKITHGMRSLLSGLDALRKPRYAILAVVQTFLIWSLTAITYWTGFLAFDITTPSLSGAFFLQSIVCLAIVLPSSPGYVGPFEAAIRFSLEFYKVASSTIIAYALMMRILALFGLVTMACLCTAQMGLSRQDMERAIAPFKE
jgi:glycosyltransferase 2 family protein